MNRPLLYGALFASLALNVFIGGAFVGAHLTKADAPAPAAQPADGLVRNPVVAAVRALPQEHRAAWRAQNPGFAETYGPKTREARRLARETLAGLGEEPFDAEQALTRLARARALEHEVRTAMDRRLVIFAGTLPADERRRFGEALARPRLSGGGSQGRALGRPQAVGQALEDR